MHARRLCAPALAFLALTGCEIDPFQFGGDRLDMFEGPDAGTDLGPPRDLGPVDLGPDLPPVPCATVTCTPGQECIDDVCVDRTCDACSGSERCEAPPTGTGVICVDNRCADDVGCPEDRFCGPAGLCDEDTCVPGTRACTTSGDIEECPPNGSATAVTLVCAGSGGFDGSCRESAGEVFCGCRDDWDCPLNTECVVDRCVGTGQPPTCLLPPADITAVLPSLEPGFPWGGEDDDRDADGSPFPASSQVVVTPIVINLDDDNDDGRIDERDIPEIVFMTFCGTVGGSARFQQHGILRAVHGGGPDRGADYFATCDDTRWFEGDDPGSVSCSCTDGDLDPTSTLAAGDLDGDGVPEIVVAGEGNAIRIFDNRGRPLAESSGGQLAGDNQALVLTNVDGRGNAEIISGRRVFQVLKDPMDGSWSFGDRWLGTPSLSTGRNGQGPISCVADLTGDGLQDVVAGTTLYRFPANPAGFERQSECSGSETGDQGSWCRGELPVEWNADDVNAASITENGFCAVADVWGADDAARPGPGNPLDRVPEVVVINDGQLQVFRGATGRILLDVDFGARGGAPNVDDFDGDGFPEIGTAFEESYLAFDLQEPSAACPAWPNAYDELVDLDPMADPLQGNPARTPPDMACTAAADCGDVGQFTCSTEGRCVCLHNGWQRVTQDDSSRVTGSSVFDFNGDGAAEVIYNDECYFRIYRGLDGDVIFREPSESRTRTENPVVADVDSDGNAEIVFAVSNESNFCTNRGRGLLPVDGDDSFPFNNGLEVWGEPSDLWVSARRIYNQHAYGVTNVYESGGLPVVPQGGWEDFGGRAYNTFRSQPRSPFGIAPDLQVAAVQFSSPDAACGELTGALDVVARVVNAGDLRVGADVPVALVGTWSGPPLTEALRDGAGTALRLTLSTVLEARGERFLSFRYDPANNGRSDLPDSIEVIIDPDGAERECDETNNRLVAPVAGAVGLADLRVEVGASAGPCPDKTFDVVILNEGTVPASDVVLRFFAGDPAAGGTAFHDERVAGPIPPGGELRLSVETRFPAVRARPFVIVDALGEVEECNDGNNTDASDELVDCSIILI